jgi:hypothetical protein
MRLEPRKNTEKPKRRAKRKAKKGAGRQTKGRKRQRRKAPPFTLVWSEPVRALRDFSSNQVIELRTEAQRRIRMAEAALEPGLDAAAVAARIATALGPAFAVGAYWFRIDFRQADLREYVVNLATPPVPGDGPKPPGENCTNLAGQSVQRAPAHRRRSSHAVIWQAIDASSEIVSRAKVTLRRPKLPSCRKYQLMTRAFIARMVRNIQYSINNRREWLGRRSQVLTSALATSWISVTRIQEFASQYVSAEARLAPRCVGQNSGMHLLLYSWIQDEPIDWSADLFGVDWAANLFGALPEEERVFR